MNDGTGVLVFWILIPLFAAVGLYLVWYSRRRKKMLATFAKNHRFRIRPEGENELRRTLDNCFKLEAKGLVRHFDQLSSIVDASPVTVFRAVELLDLNPHAQAYSTHFARIVAVFEIQNDCDDYFILDQHGQASPRVRGSNPPDAEMIEILHRITKVCKARHPLSLTFKNRHGLIYFEPLVTGGENLGDVESLYCIAQHVHEEFSGRAYE